MKKIEISNLNKKVNENRECMQGIPSKLFKTEHQIIMINRIYMNMAVDVDIEYKKELLKEIDKKIASYKTQDVNKKKYMEDNIDREEAIEKLVACKLRCYYCKCKMKVFYNMARDPSQWTLDRIDNQRPHQNENVIVACLDCNLKRRKIDKDKFLFTKQLKIVKEI